VLIEVVDALQPSEARVYIDLPVSNSGRLAQTVRFISESHGVALDAMAAPRVDETLMSLDAVVATADSAILDRCGEWVNLARLAVQHARSEVEPLWLLDFS
jgi:hypothetical protein